MNIFKDNNNWNEKAIIGFVNSFMTASYGWFLVVLESVELKSFQVKNVINLVNNERAFRGF